MAGGKRGVAGGPCGRPPIELRGQGRARCRAAGRGAPRPYRFLESVPGVEAG